MIELAILGLLKERPMHGYQLQRELSEQLGGLWRVSYGSLYPSLRRLEREGAIMSQPGKFHDMSSFMPVFIASLAIAVFQSKRRSSVFSPIMDDANGRTDVV